MRRGLSCVVVRPVSALQVCVDGMVVFEGGDGFGKGSSFGKSHDGIR